MKCKKQVLTRLFFFLACLCLLAGILSSALLFKNTDITKYPGMIADAYRETQHHLVVPGASDVFLTRTGAYGIYYEYSLVAAAVDSRLELPPALKCSLKSKVTGKKVEAVPDFVETNRYWSKGKGGTGVLIMSMTVDEPGKYTFDCAYSNGRTEPEIKVALGPNYFWEFLRVAWKIALPMLGAIILLSSSSFMALVFFVVAIVMKRKNTKMTHPQQSS